MNWSAHHAARRRFIMRITIITCILLGLVACAAGQVPVSPTISMTPVQGTPQPRIPAELPTVPAVQPPATSASASPQPFLPRLTQLSYGIQLPQTGQETNSPRRAGAAPSECLR